MISALPEVKPLPLSCSWLLSWFLLNFVKLSYLFNQFLALNFTQINSVVSVLQTQQPLWYTSSRRTCT